MVELTEDQWQAVQRYLNSYTGTSPSDLQAVQQLMADVNKANGIESYVVWVRWRDAASPHPRLIDPVGTWPPELTFQMLSDNPISKADVESLVATRTSKPAGIWITRDPAGQVGWKRIEDWP